MELTGAGILEGWSDWQRSRGLEESTIRSRAGTWRSWWSYLGEDVEAFRTADHRTVEAWVLSRGLGNKAMYRAISDLASLYKWARREAIVAGSPLELVDRPRLRQHLPRPARPAQVARPSITRNTPRVFTGRSPSWPTAGSAVSRCHGSGGPTSTWSVGRSSCGSKGGRERLVPIVDPLVAHLAPFDGSDGYVWTSTRDSQQRRPANVSHVVARHLRSSGLHHLTPHAVASPLRDPDADPRRGRPPRRSAVARSPVGVDHPDLHEGDPRRRRQGVETVDRVKIRIPRF